MYDLDVVPRRSVGPFILGRSREEVRKAALAAGIVLTSERPGMDYFLENSVQVEYADGLSDFIGVSPGVDGYRALYRGIDLGEVGAGALFDLAAEADGSGTHLFNRFEYLFPNQILTLWDADEQYDRVRRRSGEPLRVMWAQLGIGTTGYLSAATRYQAKEEALRRGPEGGRSCS